MPCHGKFPFEYMDGLEGPWHEERENFEDPDDPDMVNGCMTCHGEDFRTVRHQVTYLKPDAIEIEAKKSADVCYGCHGGRQWYKISYSYPRHPWPGMDETAGIQEWAKDRPSQSEARYRRESK